LADQEQDNVHRNFHREGEAVVFDAPLNPEETARQAREDEQHKFARQQVKTNGLLAWFTGALVLATACTIGVGIWQAIIYHKQLTAMQGQLAQMSAQSTAIQTQNTLSRDIVRGTSAAYVALSWNSPVNEPQYSPGMLFINQGIFRAENFSGTVELQCEDLLSRKIISSNQSSFGGPGVTVTKEGGFTYIPIPPKGCDSKIVFAQARRGLIRKVRFAYLNGLSEESSGGFCDEYVDLKYLPDASEPDAVFSHMAQGWKPCSDIPAFYKGALIPFDTTKDYHSANERKKHPEYQQ
jgi:hypothetical protein